MTQKHIFFVTLLGFCTLQSDPDTQQTRVTGVAMTHGTTSMASSQFTTPLTPAVINNNGTQMLARPGYYFLTDDLMFRPNRQWNAAPNVNYATSKIAWKPINGPRNIIFINSDNVVLDLNNKTITQWGTVTTSISPDASSHSTSYGVLDSAQHFPQPTDNPRDILQSLNMPNLVGIYIAPHVKNVTIKNGTINGLSGIGILVDQGCQNIKLSNLTITSVGIAGIVVGHNPLRRRIVEDSLYQYAIETDLLNDSTIHQSIKDGMHAPLHDQNPYTYAYTENQTSEIIIENVLVSKTQGHHQYFLNSPTATGTATTKEAYASKTKWLPAAVKTDAIGCQVVYTNNLQIENCSFSGNHVTKQQRKTKPASGIGSGSTATDAQWSETTGIEQHRDLNRIAKVVGATYGADTIEGTGHSGIGLQLMWVANATIENSEFSDNSGTTGRGIDMAFCNALQFTNCKANHNSSQYDPAQRKNNTLIAGAFSGTVFDTQTATPVTNFAQWQHHIGTAAGFYSQDSSDCIFERCEANSNYGYRDAAGFWLTKWYTFETTETSLGTLVDVQSATLEDFIDRRNLGPFVYRSVPIPAATPVPATQLWNANLTISHIATFGPFNNRMIECASIGNKSTYLSASGFLFAGGHANSCEQCQARGNISGKGTDAYFPTGASDNIVNPATPGSDILKAFDDGVGGTPEDNAATNPLNNLPVNFLQAVPVAFSVPGSDKIGLWGFCKEYNYVGKNEHATITDVALLHTIEYGAGFALRAITLPLHTYYSQAANTLAVATNKTNANGQKMYNNHIVTQNYVDGGALLNGTPTQYLTYPGVVDGNNNIHIQAWTEKASLIEACNSRHNDGNERGRGVGILLDGAVEATLSHNWTVNNKSNRNGAAMPVIKSGGVYTTIYTGGLGGFGIRDNLVDSSSLIMQNYAFANQTLYPKFLEAATALPSDDDIVSQKFVEGGNYFASFIQSNESFQSTAATVGEFGALNVANPYANIEWSHVGLPNGPLFGRETSNAGYFNQGSYENDLTSDWQ